MRRRLCLCATGVGRLLDRRKPPPPSERAPCERPRDRRSRCRSRRVRGRYAPRPPRAPGGARSAESPTRGRAGRVGSPFRAEGARGAGTPRGRGPGRLPTRTVGNTVWWADAEPRHERFDADEPGFHTDRAALERVLVAAAESAGVKVHHGTAAREAERTSGRLAHPLRRTGRSTRRSLRAMGDRRDGSPRLPRGTGLARNRPPNNDARPRRSVGGRRGGPRRFAHTHAPRELPGRVGMVDSALTDAALRDRDGGPTRSRPRAR